MAAYQTQHLSHARQLARQMQMPFPLITVDTLTPNLRAGLPLQKHGDAVVRLLDANGQLCEQIVAQTPTCAVQPTRILTRLGRLSTQAATSRLVPPDGRLYPSHRLNPA